MLVVTLEHCIGSLEVGQELHRAALRKLPHRLDSSSLLIQLSDLKLNFILSLTLISHTDLILFLLMHLLMGFLRLFHNLRHHLIEDNTELSTNRSSEQVEEAEGALPNLMVLLVEEYAVHPFNVGHNHLVEVLLLDGTAYLTEMVDELCLESDNFSFNVAGLGSEGELVVLFDHWADLLEVGLETTLGGHNHTA